MNRYNSPSNRLPAFRALACSVLILTAVCGCPAQALTINLVYDTSVTRLPDAAAYEFATRYAANELANYFTDNITINIKVVAVPGTTVFGRSYFYWSGSYGYAEIRSALAAKAKTPNDITALASLPTADPTNGTDFLVTTAQAKALGLIGPSTDFDGVFQFGSGFSYTLNPSSRAVTGKFDFVGIAQHEMTEVMGRISGLNLFSDNHGYTIYDLFRYQGQGLRSFLPGNDNYFSMGGGASALKYFNFPDGNGSDPGDWAPGTNDACNAYSYIGVENSFSIIDATAMDVIGYTAQPFLFATIKFPSIGPVKAGQTVTMEATAASGLPVSYSVISGSATIYGNSITFTGVGPVTIAANQGGNYRFFPSAQVTQMVTISQGSQTIAPWMISNVTYSKTAYPVYSAKSSAGLPVTFSVQSGPAIISNGEITFTGTGVVTLAEDQAGNANFSPAPEVTTSFIVSKSNQTIAFPVISSRTVGSVDYLIALASSNLKVTYTIAGPAKLSGTALTITGAGTVIVDAHQIGDADYNAAPTVGQKFTTY